MFGCQTFVAATLLVTVVAMPAPAQGGAGQSGDKVALPQQDVTVTGCLEQQPAASGKPTVGHEGGAAAGLMLTKSVVSAGSAPTGVNKTGEAFWIAGSRAQEISAYVGQIVDVAGVMDKDGPPVMPTAATTAVTSGGKPVVHTITAATFRATGKSCQ